MAAWLVPIIVAVLTGPVVVLLQKLRSENTSQHAESRGLLEHLVIKIDNMDDKLDAHISDPAHNNYKESV
jgi:hypothetical protein